MSGDEDEGWTEIEMGPGDLLMMIAQLNGAVTQLNAAVALLDAGKDGRVSEALRNSAAYNDGVLETLKNAAERTALLRPRSRTDDDR